MIVQRGQNRQQAVVFLADRGRIVEGPTLGYPLVEKQLWAVLAQMSALADSPPQPDPLAKWRLALISHYIYYSQARRGLIIRWSEGMDASELSRAIESATDQLALRVPKRRGKKKSNARST